MPNRARRPVPLAFIAGSRVIEITHALASRFPRDIGCSSHIRKLLGRTETLTRDRMCTFRRSEQLETSPETIEQELRTPTDRLKENYSIDGKREVQCKMMDMVVPGNRRRGRPRLRWTDNNREDMTKYELTADMTENRQYWKMMVKTGPQRSGDGL